LSTSSTAVGPNEAGEGSEGGDGALAEFAHFFHCCGRTKPVKVVKAVVHLEMPAQEGWRRIAGDAPQAPQPSRT